MAKLQVSSLVGLVGFARRCRLTPLNGGQLFLLDIV